MRILHCSAGLVLLVVVGRVPAQVIAIAGFNDTTGFNANGIPNSPYNVAGGPLAGGGAGETGWFTPWTTSNNPATVVNSGQFEGDGAAFFQGTAGGQRVFTLPLSGRVAIDIRMKILSSATSGNGVNFYVRQQANQAVGPNWQAAGDGRWLVVDGNESGLVTLLDTGFTWTPGSYQTITTVINTSTRTWEFLVNGVKYNSPTTLGYREAPVFLDQIDFFNAVGSPNGTFLDAVVVATVPEPSTFALALMGAVGLIIRRRYRISA